jgi:hypothetical protein
MIIVVAVAVSVIATIGIFIFSKWIRHSVDMWRLRCDLDAAQKERAREEKIERERYEVFVKEFDEKIETKIRFMENLGLERVIGLLGTMDYSMWILRENGKIKELYDLDANRIPLANLSMCMCAKVIGIEPDIYYYSEKISARELMLDSYDCARHPKILKDNVA